MFTRILCFTAAIGSLPVWNYERKKQSAIETIAKEKLNVHLFPSKIELSVNYAGSQLGTIAPYLEAAKKCKLPVHSAITCLKEAEQGWRKREIETWKLGHVERKKEALAKEWDNLNPGEKEKVLREVEEVRKSLLEGKLTSTHDLALFVLRKYNPPERWESTRWTQLALRRVDSFIDSAIAVYGSFFR